MNRLGGTRYQQGPITPELINEGWARMRKSLGIGTENNNNASKFTDEQIAAAKKIIAEQFEQTRASIKHGLTIYRESERAKKNRAKRRRKAL